MIGDKRNSAPYIGPCGICGSDVICVHDEALAQVASGKKTDTECFEEALKLYRESHQYLMDVPYQYMFSWEQSAIMQVAQRIKNGEPVTKAQAKAQKIKDGQHETEKAGN